MASRGVVDSGLRRELRARIDAFADDLETLIRRAALQAVADALGAPLPEAATAKPPRPRKPPPNKPAKLAKPTKEAKAPAGKRVRRSAEAIDAAADAILQYVSKHPGQRAEEIKSALRLSATEWPLPVKKLLDDGRISTQGAKRATTYSAKS